MPRGAHECKMTLVKHVVRMVRINGNMVLQQSSKCYRKHNLDCAAVVVVAGENVV